MLFKLEVVTDWCSAEGCFTSTPTTVLVVEQHRVCEDCAHEALWPDGCGEGKEDRRETEKTKDLLEEEIGQLKSQVRGLQAAGRV